MSEDTWGISGPTFLGLFAGIAMLAIVGTAVARRVLAHGSLRSGWEPDPEELAYFSGGSRQAVLAALAGLRAADAISASPGGTLAAGGRPPTAPSALTWAVYQAAQRGAKPRTLTAEPALRPALTTIRDTLIRHGWLLPAGRRALIRSMSLVLFAVAALGVARIMAGLADDKPVGFLIAMTVVVGLFGLARLVAPRRTVVAHRALAAARARHSYLAPQTYPAMATYGASGAALAVGLFGAGALWATDPDLAAEAGITRGSAGSGSGSDGGGGCGAGDSGGGGGGGGGGGCGG